MRIAKNDILSQLEILLLLVDYSAPLTLSFVVAAAARAILLRYFATDSSCFAAELAAAEVAVVILQVRALM